MIASSKSRTTLLLFGTPLLWITQMSLSESISAYTCYPQGAPLAAPLWSALPQILAAINILCAIGGVACAILSWKEWRSAQSPALRQRPEAQQGRIRFLGLLGVMSSFLFVVAILFTTCANLLVSPCARWL